MKNIELYLSEELYELKDIYSGKPVAYYRIQQRRIPEDIFSENTHKLVYSIECNKWLYIVRKVTREECIKLYGPITNEEYGPRGGWKSVTFGTTRFAHDYLRL